MSPSEIAVVYLWIVLASMVSMLVVMAGFDGGIGRAIRSWRQIKARGGKPDAQEDLDLMARHIADLIRNGTGVASLRFEHQKKGSKLALQFVKYIRAPGDYGIELEFTLFKWAQDYAPKIEAYCTAEGLPCHIRPRKKPRGWEVLSVDCGRDLGRAFALARHIWTEVFGLEANSLYHIERHGIWPFGERFDRPGQGPSAGCLGDLVWVPFLVVFIGMILTAADSPGAPPDWGFEAAGLVFAGTTSSLVFYLLYLGFVSYRLLHPKRPGKDLEVPDWLLRTFRGWSLWVRLTLPLAVPITWLGW